MLIEVNKYVIKYGESIIDVSVKLYGSVQYVFDLILWNPILENINNTAIVGLEIIYEPIIVSEFKPVVTDTKPIIKNVTIKENQSVFDLSLQIYGSVENVFDVLKLTGISDINEFENKGINFSYEYKPLKIPKYLSERNLSLATLIPFDKIVYRIVDNGDFREIDTNELRIVN